MTPRARPRTHRRALPKAVIAALLLGASLAVLLGAWFVAGWAEVRAREAALLAAPAARADARAATLASALRDELDGLLRRELPRPYFHYQNLMRDPRASRGEGVTPSPLASGPTEPLVAGYFQLDPQRGTTTPPINDDVPALSDAQGLATHRRFRDEVMRSLAATLTPAVRIATADTLIAQRDPRPEALRPSPRPRAERPPLVAQAAAPDVEAVPRTANAAVANVAQAEVPDAAPAEPPAQVVTIDPDSYIQNQSSNSIYQRQAPLQRQALAPQQVTVPPQAVPPRQAPVRRQAPIPQAALVQRQAAGTTPAAGDAAIAGPVPGASASASAGAGAGAGAGAAPARVQPPRPDALPGAARSDLPPRATTVVPSSRGTSPRAVSPPRAPAEAEAAPPITIVVSSLGWRTLPFGGVPTLVAVREVDTPDGTLAQGFVVDRASLTGWLAARGEEGAGGSAGDGAGADVIVELRADAAGASAASAATALAPGWALAARPHPRALNAAAAQAHALARAFVVRFALIGLVALLVGGLVVSLVARAERLARERSQFAAAAAHELRTPLAGLQLYGDMLADGLGDPGKQREYARRMSEEAARLGRVVSNVLGFSQLERGNLSVEARAGRVDLALRELAERAEPALDRAGAALALDVAPELEARFDPDALARIVGNLLDNAEKYARGAEDRTITLAARVMPGARDRGADVVEIVVSDHGPGIAAPARSRLFRPFVRGVPADGPAGLGLGLALSQSLARAMGGELVHRPGPEGGAAFVLRLPAG